MLDDAADVIEAGVREIGVARPGEQRLAALPQRLVDVHARTVVARDGLGHEGRRLAVGRRNLMHDVLVDLQIVAALDQSIELAAKLMLRAGHFVMVLFRLDAHVAHDRQHFAADVLVAVHRRNREIAALDRRTMAQIAAFVFGAGVVGAADRVDRIEGLVHLHVEADVVENEEFRFGAEIGGVGDAGGSHVFLGGLGDRARAALIMLSGGGDDDVAVDHQRGLRKEGVDHGRAAIGHQGHVGVVDCAPARDRRSVEHQAVGERILIDLRKVEGHVLPLAARVCESPIDEFDVLGFDHRQDALCISHSLGLSLLSWNSSGSR